MLVFVAMNLLTGAWHPSCFGSEGGVCLVATGTARGILSETGKIIGVVGDGQRSCLCKVAWKQ